MYIRAIFFSLLCGGMCLGQISNIDRVYVESEYNSDYILTHAGNFFATRGPLSRRALSCAVRDLESSSMFEKIKVEIRPGENEKNFLYIIPKYRGNPSKYQISRIFIDPITEVSADALRSRLTALDIKPGISFMPFNIIGRAIADSLDNIDLNDEKTLKDRVWIKAKLQGRSKVSLYISMKKPVCGR